MGTLSSRFPFGHSKICSHHKHHLGWTINHPGNHFDEKLHLSHCTWSPNLGGVLLQVQLALTAGWPRHRTTFLLPGRSSMIVVENYLQLEIRRTRVYPGLVKSSAQPQPSLSGSIKFSPVSGFRSIGLQSFFLSTVEASLESLQRLLALPPVLVFYHTLLDKDFPLHFMR